MKKYLAVIPVIVVVVCVIIIFTGGDGDAQQSGRGTTTTTEKPYESKHVEKGGPYTEYLEKLSRKLTLESYNSNWTLGVVTDEKQDAGISVKVAKGIISLHSNCYEGPSADYLSSLVTPGDAIVWHEEGGDFNICGDEVYIVATSGEVKELMESK